VQIIFEALKFLDMHFGIKMVRFILICHENIYKLFSDINAPIVARAAGTVEVLMVVF
jgi:hypothetical protein